MLNSNPAIATIAVTNLKPAREFYESKLGFKASETDDANYATYKSGNGAFLVYKSKYAGGYKATVATWEVGSKIESLVADLKEKGVPFLHYDNLPDTKREGDIHHMGSMKNAWCHDPDGNILCLYTVE